MVPVHDLSVGQFWPSLEEARKFITEWAVSRGESFKVRKADRRKWLAICRTKDCPFRVRVSNINDTAKVTIYNPHSCPPEVHQGWRPAHSVAYLASNHLDAVLDDHSITPRQIQNREYLRIGNQISYHQAWRTKEELRRQTSGEDLGAMQGKRKPGRKRRAKPEASEGLEHTHEEKKGGQ